MSTLTVHGYHQGVSAVIVADTAEKHPLSGIIAQAPVTLTAALEATTGTTVVLGGTGPEVVASLDTIEGVLAAAHAAPGFEITGLDGDVPESYPGHEPESDRPRGEVVH